MYQTHVPCVGFFLYNPQKMAHGTKPILQAVIIRIGGGKNLRIESPITDDAQPPARHTQVERNPYLKDAGLRYARAVQECHSDQEPTQRPSSSK